MRICNLETGESEMKNILGITVNTNRQREKRAKRKGERFGDGVILLLRGFIVWFVLFLILTFLVGCLSPILPIIGGASKLYGAIGATIVYFWLLNNI